MIQRVMFMLMSFLDDIGREHTSTWDCEKRSTAVSSVLVCTVGPKGCKEQVRGSHAAIQKGQRQGFPEQQ